MLEFGQDIIWVAIVIMRMISDLNLGGKISHEETQIRYPSTQCTFFPL